MNADLVSTNCCWSVEPLVWLVVARSPVPNAAMSLALLSAESAFFGHFHSPAHGTV